MFRDKSIIKTPLYWVASLPEIYTYILQIKKGKVIKIGKSAGGREIIIVEYKPNKAIRTMVVIAGTHGHEPSTNAACINLLNILEKGQDLKGKIWPDINEFSQRLNLIIVPVLNVDGRARCLDNYFNFTVEELAYHELGMLLDGRRHDGRFDSSKILSEFKFLGGRYNDHGFRTNRLTAKGEPLAVEVKKLMDFLFKIKIDSLIDFHAHPVKPQIISSNVENFSSELQHIDRILQFLARRENQYFNPMLARWGDKLIFNIDLFAKEFKCLSFIFEGYSGVIPDSGGGQIDISWASHLDCEKIIDSYLLTVQETGKKISKLK